MCNLGKINVYFYVTSIRYKLNVIVEDATGSANFTIFGKAAQELIRIPAQILATSPGADQFTLSPPIKSIIGQKHVFQIMPETQKFRSATPSFKVTKIFPTNSDAKGKSPLGQKLLIKSEEQLQSPTANKELSTDLFTQTPSDVETPSGYSHCYLTD